mmetsp:Transcript_20879/g.45328  ORF Transcript_20879/g.45328 Transcript_20879/m.45328 type:complete len:453 (-) Transcript_20879:133-1491(-)
MTFFPSKTFLLTALLAAHVSNPTPFTRGEEITLDATTNDAAPFLDDDHHHHHHYLLHAPSEYLQWNPPSVVLATTFPDPTLHARFAEWKEDFARAYASEYEGALRKLIWLDNHDRIERHNNNNNNMDEHHREGGAVGHALAHNDFSDMTNDEFRRRFYLGEYSPGVVSPKGLEDGSWMSSSERRLRGENEDDDDDDDDEDDEEELMAETSNVPEHKNWNEEGAVTKVKNQWFCGACWAFSAIGAIEGARYIQTGNLTELSIQQLIDCDKTDLGCGGGLMYNAFTYDAQNSVGLCALEDYPYAYHRHWFWGCQRKMSKCTPLHSTKVQQYVNVSETEEALKGAIAVQPVSVAVAAGGFDWQFYAGGVFHQDCDEDIDHGVLAVGYGHYDPSTDPSPTTPGGAASDYWLIKNSWGSRWGVDGFMQLSRGTGNEEKGGSACILTLASRPIMKTSD